MGDPTDRAKLVQQKLVMDSSVTFAETVEKSSRVLKLDQGGQLHPQVDLTRYGTKQKSELFLLARYLGNAGGLTTKVSASDEEIAKHFGLKLTEVQKRLHDLKKAGKVIPAEDGGYRLTEGRVSEVLADLEVRD